MNYTTEKIFFGKSFSSEYDALKKHKNRDFAFFFKIVTTKCICFVFSNFVHSKYVIRGLWETIFFFIQVVGVVGMVGFNLLWSASCVEKSKSTNKRFYDTKSTSTASKLYADLVSSC